MSAVPYDRTTEEKEYSMDPSRELLHVRRLLKTGTLWINLPRRAQEACLRQAVGQVETREELLERLNGLSHDADWKITWNDPLPKERAKEVARECRELGGLVSKNGKLVRIKLAGFAEF